MARRKKQQFELFPAEGDHDLVETVKEKIREREFRVIPLPGDKWVGLRRHQVEVMLKMSAWSQLDKYYKARQDSLYRSLIKVGVVQDEAHQTVKGHADLLKSDYWRERDRRGITTPEQPKEARD